MSDDDLAQDSVRRASGSREESVRFPRESVRGRILHRIARVCGFAGLGVGVGLLFLDLQPAGLAIIFVAVAVLLAEFEDLVCSPPNQRT